MFCGPTVASGRRRDVPALAPRRSPGRGSAVRTRLSSRESPRRGVARRSGLRHEGDAAHEVQNSRVTTVVSRQAGLNRAAACARPRGALATADDHEATLLVEPPQRPGDQADPDYDPDDAEEVEHRRPRLRELWVRARLVEGRTPCGIIPPPTIPGVTGRRSWTATIVLQTIPCGTGRVGQSS
jgi:hypothetical protein